jgi:hypothetical protein
MPSLADTPPPTPPRAPGLHGQAFEFVRNWMKTDGSLFPQLWDGLDAIFVSRSNWTLWPQVEKIVNDASEDSDTLTTALLNLDDLESDVPPDMPDPAIAAPLPPAPPPAPPHSPPPPVTPTRDSKSPPRPLSPARPLPPVRPLSPASRPAQLPAAVARGSNVVWISPDGGIFSSPNMDNWPEDVPPDGPAEHNADGERWSELTNSSAETPNLPPVDNPLHIRWANINEPWLPYVVADGISEVGVFKSLAFPEHPEALTVEDTDGHKARRAKDWLLQERWLLQLGEVLYTNLVATWSMGANFKWTEPSVRGWWNRPHPVQATALRAARVVYYMLLKLCAVVSLYCAIAAHSNNGPDWWCGIATENGMDTHEDRQWLSGVKQSFVPRFHGVRRVGVFVDVRKFAPAKLLDVYLSSNVPLYLFWGKDRAAIPTLLDGDTALDHLRPTVTELDAAGVPHVVVKPVAPPAPRKWYYLT